MAVSRGGSTYNFVIVDFDCAKRAEERAKRRRFEVEFHAEHRHFGVDVES